MEFLDAGGAVVGKVDECAGESVGNASGGDALGRVALALSLFGRGKSE